MPKLAELLAPEIRQCLSEAIERPTSDFSTPRVHRLPSVHKVPPEPREWRAPRMGNVPRMRAGSMPEVYQEIVRYGLRSPAVSYRSYESKQFPK